MGNSPIFDYDQPTPDTLAGVFVEVSDEPLEQADDVEAQSAGQSARLSALFGLTQTADDSIDATQSNARSASRRSAEG